MGDRDLVVEEPLQAVVLADSFATRFRPVTLETPPKALLPLCGVPLIEYTLEFLASANVRQIILICSSHGDLIEQHIVRSEKSRPPGFPNVITLVLPHCRSSVDALRFIGEKQLVRSNPFILVHSDVVANVNLKPILDEHKKRSKMDVRNAITMVLKRVPHNHRTRSVDDERLVAVADTDEGTRLLMFKDTRRQSSVKVPSELFTGGGPYDKRSQVRFHFDLMDCHLDLCSPDILNLLTDEFDWFDLRKHMVEEILTSEVHGFKIFCKIISEEYAARVTDFKSYDAVSKDVISRWVFPICLENFNMLGRDVESNGYQFENVGRNVYRDRRNVVIARSASVGPNCVIGRGTSIGERATVYECVIGANCIIGSGVILQNAYIWDNVIIESGVRVDRSLLCHNVSIGRNSRIEKGSVLSYGVKIGPDVALPPYTQLTIVEESFDASSSRGDEFDAFGFSEESPSIKQTSVKDSNQKQVWDEMLVGAGGVGRLYDDTYSALSLLGIDVNQLEDEELDKFDKKLICTLGSLAPDACRLEDFETEDFQVEDLYGADDDDFDLKSDEGKQFADNFSRLMQEVYETMRRFWKENEGIPKDRVDKNNIALEVSDLKPSFHATLSDWSAAVFVTLYRFVTSAKNADSIRDEKKILESIQKWWHFLFLKYTDSDEDSQAESEVLQGLKKACCDVHTDGTQSGGVYLNYMPQSIQWLYLEDVVSGEAILEWYDDNACKEKLVETLLSRFITIVRENEADDGEEEEE